VTWEESRTPSPTAHGHLQSHEHSSREALGQEAFPLQKSRQPPLHNHEARIQAPHAHAPQCIHVPMIGAKHQFSLNGMNTCSEILHEKEETETWLPNDGITMGED
jgi:hypothetical protein